MIKEAGYADASVGGHRYRIRARSGGAQPGGSSIQVLELYTTNEGIVCDTQLVGGGKNTDNETTSAYPYIVVKLLCDEQNVVFE